MELAKQVGADGRIIPFDDMSVPVTQTDLVRKTASGAWIPIIDLGRHKQVKVKVSGDQSGNRNVKGGGPMDAAIFNFKLEGGTTFGAKVGAVRDILPHKQRGKSVVQVLWGRKHGWSAGKKSEIRDMVAVGDHRQLKARLEALRGAGSDAKEETTMSVEGMKQPWDMPYRQDRMKAQEMGMTVCEYRIHLKREQARKKREAAEARKSVMQPEARKTNGAQAPKVVKPAPVEVQEPEPTTEELLAKAQEELETAKEMVAQAEIDVAELRGRLEVEQEAARQDARKVLLIELLQSGASIEEALEALKQ